MSNEQEDSTLPTMSCDEGTGDAGITRSNRSMSHPPCRRTGVGRCWPGAILLAAAWSALMPARPALAAETFDERVQAGIQKAVEYLWKAQRPAILLSREDITVALLGCSSTTCDGYDPESAFRLLRNIVLFANP